MLMEQGKPGKEYLRQHLPVVSPKEKTQKTHVDGGKTPQGVGAGGETDLHQNVQQKNPSLDKQKTSGRGFSFYKTGLFPPAVCTITASAASREETLFSSRVCATQPEKERHGKNAKSRSFSKHREREPHWPARGARSLPRGCRTDYRSGHLSHRPNGRSKLPERIGRCNKHSLLHLPAQPR